MTVRIYKLDKEGYRVKSYTEIFRVTKIEEIDGILHVHTYFSDNCGDPVSKFYLDRVGVDVFVGRN